jgi:hypothetical protein
MGAEELFKRALGAVPELAHVLCSYGILRLNCYNDVDGAEGLYRRALAVDPAHIPTLYNYGSLCKLCVCVCLYVCVCMCVYEYIYIYMRACMYVSVLRA